MPRRRVSNTSAALPLSIKMIDQPQSSNRFCLVGPQSCLWAIKMYSLDFRFSYSVELIDSSRDKGEVLSFLIFFPIGSYDISCKLWMRSRRQEAVVIASTAL